MPNMKLTKQNSKGSAPKSPMNKNAAKEAIAAHHTKGKVAAPKPVPKKKVAPVPMPKPVPKKPAKAKTTQNGKKNGGSKAGVRPIINTSKVIKPKTRVLKLGNAPSILDSRVHGPSKLMVYDPDLMMFEPNLQDAPGTFEYQKSIDKSIDHFTNRKGLDASGLSVNFSTSKPRAANLRADKLDDLKDLVKQNVWGDRTKNKKAFNLEHTRQTMKKLERDFTHQKEWKKFKRQEGKEPNWRLRAGADWKRKRMESLREEWVSPLDTGANILWRKSKIENQGFSGYQVTHGSENYNYDRQMQVSPSYRLRGPLRNTLNHKNERSYLGEPFGFTTSPVGKEVVEKAKAGGANKAGVPKRCPNSLRYENKWSTRLLTSKKFLVSVGKSAGDRAKVANAGKSVTSNCACKNCVCKKCLIAHASGDRVIAKTVKPNLGYSKKNAVMAIKPSKQHSQLSVGNGGTSPYSLRKGDPNLNNARSKLKRMVIATHFLVKTTGLSKRKAKQQHHNEKLNAVHQRSKARDAGHLPMPAKSPKKQLSEHAGNLHSFGSNPANSSVLIQGAKGKIMLATDNDTPATSPSRKAIAGKKAGGGSRNVGGKTQSVKGNTGMPAGRGGGIRGSAH